MKQWEKLYKKDSKGKVREWSVEQDGDKYRTIAGSSEGKKVVSEWTVCEVKHAGKSNEVTPEEQATKEVEAMYVKKKKSGYFDNVEDIDSCTLIKPMLALKFKDYGDKISMPVYSQPKLDGFRCITKPDGLWSRRGEKFITCPHIEDKMVKLSVKHNVIFDGELYNHEFKDDFNSLQSLINKKKPTLVDYEQTAKLVEYHIYDIVDTDKTFEERMEVLNKISEELSDDLTIKFVATDICKDSDDLDNKYSSYLLDGYEGQMVRVNVEYQLNKRSKHLLKRKEFTDAEFTIVDIEEGIGNRSGMAGRVTCQLPNGNTFGAGIKGGIEVNKQLWADKESLIGRKATIEFFNLTPDGVPRFPVFKCVREDI